MTVADRVKNLREKYGWTQEELAIRCGYETRATICKIEKQGDDITQKKIVRLAEALHTSVPYLMGWLDEEPEQTAAEDVDLLRKFHSLTPANQRTVKILIDSLLQGEDS